MTPADNFYAKWRARIAAPAFREGNGVPAEKLLQAVWQHQRLLRDCLNTSDGKTLRILHPGFKNQEAGPDFRDALIQIGDSPPQTGDIEVDVSPSGWRSHGHHTNPDFKQVMLHVVWDAGRIQTPATMPVLQLKDVLDAPLADLAGWYGDAASNALPEAMRGRCCSPLTELPEERVLELLQQASLVRLRSKADWLTARARQAGWEQALWEGLFRALGYKQNIWPMQRLAELRERLIVGENDSPLVLQARLLGVGGLLPHEFKHGGIAADEYLRQVWDVWWRERDEFGAVTLPRSCWRFNGIRPANHPQRRLALAAHWLSRQDLPQRLEKWATSVSRPLEDSLLKILTVGVDGFWSHHWTLRSKRVESAQPLLGKTRVTDLAVNVILPWLWARAKAGRSDELRMKMQQAYLVWPAGEDNSGLKLARQRLLGGAGRGFLQCAAAQQGLMQIVQDFCGRSNAVCEHCGFPELVRAWSARESSSWSK